MKLTRWMSVLALAGAALFLVACGGGSGNSSTSEGSTNAGSSASESREVNVPPPLTSPPEDNPITVPLSKAPPKGKTVLFLQCELPVCELFVPGLEEATAALGWNLETQVFNSADPGKGLQQAIDQKPDYIAITSVPTSVMKPQMEAAHKAGIPVISCNDPERPSPEGFAAQCAATLTADAENAGSWMITDSGAQAQVMGVTIPLYPILETETGFLEEEFKEMCPECEYESLQVTPEDIGQGLVPQKVVGFLQSHPNIDYIYTTFGDLTQGLPEILQSSGYADKVKIVGAAGDASIIQQIPDKFAAFSVNPHPWMSWAIVDAMARLSNGEELSTKYQNELYSMPIWLVDSKASVESLKPYGYEWPGPGNGTFRADFEKLWHVR